ncbi:hypothetical protein CCUS01_17288 [Colletotrichum cuscutae]|uniref:Uncharacterized protein n=1 Tax=Colletotrichum cuscutae TaxID=1209917 RepID=A0AAI9VBX3_9PEZI|nr:hypothetical protein CCUS01_17288 [Colletotrichum cuscutae]
MILYPRTKTQSTFPKPIPPTAEAQLKAQPSQRSKSIRRRRERRLEIDISSTGGLGHTASIPCIKCGPPSVPTASIPQQRPTAGTLPGVETQFRRVKMAGFGHDKMFSRMDLDWDLESRQERESISPAHPKPHCREKTTALHRIPSGVRSFLSSVIHSRPMDGSLPILMNLHVGTASPTRLGENREPTDNEKNHLQHVRDGNRKKGQKKKKGRKFPPSQYPPYQRLPDGKRTGSRKEGKKIFSILASWIPEVHLRMKNFVAWLWLRPLTAMTHNLSHDGTQWNAETASEAPQITPVSHARSTLEGYMIPRMVHMQRPGEGRDVTGALTPFFWTYLVLISVEGALFLDRLSNFHCRLTPADVRITQCKSVPREDDPEMPDREFCKLQGVFATPPYGTYPGPCPNWKPPSRRHSGRTSPNRFCPRRGGLGGSLAPLQQKTAKPHSLRERRTCLGSTYIHAKESSGIHERVPWDISHYPNAMICCCCRQSKLASDSPESPSACSKDFHPFAYPNQALPACRAAVLRSRFFGDSTSLTHERSGLVSIGGGSLMVCMGYTRKRPLISSSRGVITKQERESIGHLAITAEVKEAFSSTRHFSLKRGFGCGRVLDPVHGAPCWFGGVRRAPPLAHLVNRAGSSEGLKSMELKGLGEVQNRKQSRFIRRPLFKDAELPSLISLCLSPVILRIKSGFIVKALFRSLIFGRHGTVFSGKPPTSLLFPPVPNGGSREDSRNSQCFFRPVCEKH